MYISIYVYSRYYHGTCSMQRTIRCDMFEMTQKQVLLWAQTLENPDLAAKLRGGNGTSLKKLLDDFDDMAQEFGLNTFQLSGLESSLQRLSSAGWLETSDVAASELPIGAACIHSNTHESAASVVTTNVNINHGGKQVAIAGHVNVTTDHQSQVDNKVLSELKQRFALHNETHDAKDQATLSRHNERQHRIVCLICPGHAGVLVKKSNFHNYFAKHLLGTDHIAAAKKAYGFKPKATRCPVKLADPQEIVNTFTDWTTDGQTMTHTLCGKQILITETKIIEK